MTFSETEANNSPAAATRIRRQLAEQAIASAAAGKWAEAAETNRRLLEMAPEADAENRLAKALWELGELGSAREHYQLALALDPTNRIAERNIDRLRTLLVAAGEKTVPAQDGSKAPVRIFVEETGKTGFAHLIDLPDAKKLAQVNPGDSVEMTPEGNRLIAFSNGMRIGVEPPRAAPRLLILVDDDNYLPGGASPLAPHVLRIILHNFHHPPRYDKNGCPPTGEKSTDLRPYTKGTLLREDDEIEEDLKDDVEDEEITDLDRVLPPRTRPTRPSSKRPTKPTSPSPAPGPVRRVVASAGPLTHSRVRSRPCSAPPCVRTACRARIRTNASRRCRLRSFVDLAPGNCHVELVRVVGGRARHSEERLSVAGYARLVVPAPGAWMTSAA